MLKVPNLENKHRTKIAKAIITYIHDNDPERKLSREEFIQLAQYIVEIFPTEVSETYYVPFRNRHLPKGKLYDAYNNNRTRLRAAGVISKREKLDTEEKVVENSSVDDNEAFQDFQESDLDILQSPRIESWDEVVMAWKKSHQYRQNELQNEQINALEYVDKYAVLQNEKCDELFEIDFKLMYPKAKSINEWRNYYYKVMDKTKHMRDNWIRDIFKNIEDAENCNEEDSKLAFALMLVPYIIPNPRYRRKQEIQECFITYSQSDPFAEDDQCEQQQQHTVKRLKIENEPKIYFVGNNCKPISHAYIDMPGLRMKFDKPLKAVEVCFKCFMAMKIRYPKSCFYVWVLIQQLIFGVKTKHDSILPNVTTLINDLSNE
ncbi:uncharacterized protein LOC106087822 [Stomoxys calcitrans]|uniref:uncharacterized protein LOC106087822 n=1 Tax=Stomoxys calcitrans TaxID=35570 RepID=UPI0027E33124|nr:uncharacterized protein LOC106087822 [Stomoxys calcitrans]